VWGAVHLATFEPQPTVCMNLADERSCGAIDRVKRVHRTVDPGVAGSNPVGLASQTQLQITGFAAVFVSEVPFAESYFGNDLVTTQASYCRRISLRKFPKFQWGYELLSLRVGQTDPVENRRVFEDVQSVVPRLSVRRG
jgi:hypothetical protein